MDITNRKWWITAAILGCLAVGIGAFGAHGLKSFIANEGLPLERLNIYEVGVRYHFFHTFALFVALLAPLRPKFRKIALWCFVLGILFFSGSLYLLTIREYVPIPTAILGPITPIGGLTFMVGWLVMALGISKQV